MTQVAWILTVIYSSSGIGQIGKNNRQLDSHDKEHASSILLTDCMPECSGFLKVAFIPEAALKCYCYSLYISVIH